MTLCIAIRVRNGLVAIADGMTSYFSAREGDAARTPQLNAMKCTVAPENQPWLLMYADRATYRTRPTSQLVQELAPSLARSWATAHTLGAGAKLVGEYFTDLDNEIPGAPLIDVATGEVFASRFSGLLCGYTRRGEEQIWLVESHPNGAKARQIREDFGWIGSEGAAGEAIEAMTDPGSQPPEVRSRIGLLDDESVVDMEVHTAGTFALAALRIKASADGSFWPGWGVGGQWVGYTITPMGTTAIEN